jgi:hypothetical protein
MIISNVLFFTLKVKVSEVVFVKPFLKIYAQNDSGRLNALKPLKSLYEAAKALTNVDIILGEIYVGKIDQQRYDRCRVIEVNDFTSIASVDFIDHGRQGRLPYSKLRRLGESTILHSMPAACEQYVIAELIVSVQHENFRQKLEKLRELIVNKVFRAVIVAKVSN